MSLDQYKVWINNSKATKQHTQTQQVFQVFYLDFGGIKAPCSKIFRITNPIEFEYNT